MTSFAIQAGALRENPNSGPDGVGVQADIAYTLEARAEVQAVCGVASGLAVVPANDNNPHPPLRFLSVCSGIEAASVAWHPLGWRAVAFAEIEKFPSAVLAHHYPDVPNLGDFTKINTRTLGRVDILAGGTPCQAFSVAGLRKGLDDARGNLTLKFVELAHELADGNGLRNVVWENVVGVLSDKGNAFGCFLAGLVGADTAIDPPSRGKWPTHGMVAGPKGRAAWAVKDAQYFGVAQRRRRVLVVADFGNGADPAAVLFEPESVCRNSPPSREAGKGVAPTISARTKGGGGLGTDFDLDGGLIETVATIDANYGRLGGASGQDANHGHSHLLPVAYGGNRQSGPLDVATAVNAHGGPYGRLDFESETFVTQAIGVTGQTSHALTAEGADASEDGTGRGTPVVCIHADSIGRTGEAVTPSADAAGVVRLRNPGMGIVDDGTSYNLMASGQPHAITVAIRGRDGGATAELGGDVATALRASQGGGDKPHVLAFAQNTRDEVRLQGGDGQIVGALAAQPGMKQTTYLVTSAVRRLTPRECERLQGFPDDYTLIPTRKVSKANQPKAAADTTGAFEEIAGEWWTMSADGPRYKALGNSWAVPKFVWLGKRITALMPPSAANDNQPQSSPAAGVAA